MELFSQTFVSMVRDVLKNPKSTIIATIPVPKGRPIPFVEEIRNHTQVQVFTVREQKYGNIQSLDQDIKTEYLLCIKREFLPFIRCLL